MDKNPEKKKKCNHICHVPLCSAFVRCYLLLSPFSDFISCIFPPWIWGSIQTVVSLQILPDRKSPLLTLLPKQHCAEVFKLLFVCVCVCVCARHRGNMKAYWVSTEDWVSERKLIIPPSVVFWLSWRSRYSLVLLFSVLRHSGTFYIKKQLLGSLSRPFLGTCSGRAFDRPRMLEICLVLAYRCPTGRQRLRLLKTQSVHRESLMPSLKMFFGAHQTPRKCRVPPALSL